MKDINTAAIAGMGALGLLFGSRIRESLGNDALVYVMDPERLERGRKAVYTINGEAVTFPMTTPADLAAAPGFEGCSLIIVATKYGGLRGAADLIKPLVKENTVIISLLNGISSEEILAETFDREQIIDCVAIGMDAVRAGTDLTYENMGRLQIGLHTGSARQKENLARLVDFLTRAKVPYEICDDIQRAMWNKFLINVAVNQTCMVYETTYSGMMEDEAAKRDLLDAMYEVMEAAKAEGISLTEEDIQKDLALLKTLNPDGYPSMRQDAMAKRPSEVRLFAGTMLEIGEKHGLTFPVNRKYASKIAEMEATYGR